MQEESETIDQFAERLRRKAQQCDYGDQMEAQIQDQIVSKCRSNELRRKLLEKGQTLTLQNLQEIAPNYDAVKRQTQSMSLSSEPVNRVHDSLPRRTSRNYSAQSGNKCYRCGRRGGRRLSVPRKRKNVHKMLSGWIFCNYLQTKALGTPSRSTIRCVH